MVDIFDFVSYMVLVTIARLCHCGIKAAIANIQINGYDCVQYNLYKNQTAREL